MTLPELRKRIDSAPGILVYFSTPDCGVCTVLRPKVEALLNEHFPRIEFLYVDCEASPEAAAQESVFAVPTVVIYLRGREQLRRSRHFGIEELSVELARPYSIIFGD